MRMIDEDVAAKAIKVLNDIDWPFDIKKGARPYEKTIKIQVEEVSSQKKHPRFDEYVATLFPYWLVLFDYPEDDGWQGRNMMRVLIKDETGEPYEIGHRQWKGKGAKRL